MDAFRTLFLIVSLFLFTKSQLQSKMRIVCYYTDWRQQWNISFRLQPRNIDPTLCTHVVYAFAMPDLNQGIIPTDWLRTLEERWPIFVALKQQNPSLKLMLSIGGWPEGWIQFSRIAADREKRQWFAEYICNFIRDRHFDGLDINWQWPGIREGSNSLDKVNYATMIKEFKEYFVKEGIDTERERLLLTVVLPQLREVASKGYDMETVAQNVDFFNVFSLDYHSSVEPFVDHPAPLYSTPRTNFTNKFTVDTTIRYYIEMGINPKMLNLGISTYGHSYVLENPAATALGSLSEDEGPAGFATTTPGILAYFEICKHIKEENWMVEYPNATAMGPIAHHEKNWVAYDDTEIVKRKVRYAIEKGLGGVFLWTIDLDDFKGFCYNNFPLLSAAKEAVDAAVLDLPSVNEINPPASPLFNIDQPPFIRPVLTSDFSIPQIPQREYPEETTETNSNTIDPCQSMPPIKRNPQSQGDPNGCPTLPNTQPMPPNTRPMMTQQGNPNGFINQNQQPVQPAVQLPAQPAVQFPAQPAVQFPAQPPAQQPIYMVQPKPVPNPFLNGNHNYRFVTNQSFTYRNLRLVYNKNCYDPMVC